MVKLSIADNVENAAHTLLRQQGFDLHVIDVAAGKPPILVATDKEHELRGRSALEILGLLTLVRMHGEDWQPPESEEHHRTKFWDAAGDEDGRNS